jgi:hypothetical protein
VITESWTDGRIKHTWNPPPLPVRHSTLGIRHSAPLPWLPFTLSASFIVHFVEISQGTPPVRHSAISDFFRISPFVLRHCHSASIRVHPASSVVKKFAIIREIRVPFSPSFSVSVQASQTRQACTKLTFSSVPNRTLGTLGK